jgi:large subunit ribosomal protein L37Ae
MVSRYGVKIRKLEGKILREMRQKHSCPKCGKKSVKRLGTGLWKCRSCGAVMAGGAYLPKTDIGRAADKIVASANQ